MEPDELLERRAVFVYEATRLHALHSGAPIVPEAWEDRDMWFRNQFRNVIEMMCSPRRKTDPKELHDDWMKAYEKEGWVFGTERDPVKKTHPDMVPFEDLEILEQVKDAVFVALCEVARQWIVADENYPPSNELRMEAQRGLASLALRRRDGRLDTLPLPANADYKITLRKDGGLLVHAWTRKARPEVGSA